MDSAYFIILFFSISWNLKEIQCTPSNSENNGGNRFTGENNNLPNANHVQDTSGANNQRYPMNYGESHDRYDTPPVYYDPRYEGSNLIAPNKNPYDIIQLAQDGSRPEDNVLILSSETHRGIDWVFSDCPQLSNDNIILIRGSMVVCYILVFLILIIIHFCLRLRD